MAHNDQGLTTFRESVRTWREACYARRVTKRNVPKAKRELRKQSRSAASEPKVRR